MITIAGALWVFIGAFLIFRGAGLYQLAVDEQQATQTAVYFSLAVGLIVGVAKGRFVLSKTARKNRARIQGLEENPVKLHHLFAKPFYVFIAGMILLGILIRTYNEFLGGYVVVAAIYCGIGLALVVSSRVYWKSGPETPMEERA